MSWILALSLASAQSPDCAGCRILEEGGWSRDGETLTSPDGVEVGVDVMAGDKAPFSVSSTEDDLLVQQSLLQKSLEERGLALGEVNSRVVRSPLGESQVILEYDVEGEEAPPRGVRLVKRCQTAVALSVEGDAPATGTLLQAARQVIWEPQACREFNAFPWVEEVDLGEAREELKRVDLTEPPEPALAEEVIEEVEETRAAYPAWYWAVAGGVMLLIMFGLVANRMAKKQQVERMATPLVNKRGESTEPVFDANLEEEEPKPAKKSLFSREPKPVKDPAGEALVAALQGTEDGAPAASDLGGGSLGAMVTGLSDAMGAKRTGAPAAKIPEVPPEFAEYLGLANGHDWGNGWLRFLGVGGDYRPDAVELNKNLGRTLGGRFAMGYGGFGIIVALENDGAVVACEPYFGSVVRLAPDLKSFLRDMAHDPAKRMQVCDTGRLDQAIGEAGPLDFAEVYDPGSTEGRKVRIVDLWADAQPMAPA